MTEQAHEHSFVIGQLDNVQTAVGGRTNFTAKVCGCGTVEVHPVENWALLSPEVQALVTKRLVMSVVQVDEETTIRPNKTKPGL